MERFLTMMGLFGVFAVNWATLHDIVKGNEPDLYSESTVVSASIALFVAVGARNLEQLL